MNPLSNTSLIARLNAFAAATVITMTLLSGIDALALLDSGAPILAQTVITRLA